MISIIVDEAYAYDYLCILSVKENNWEYHDSTYNIIKLQVGEKLHYEIIASEEYAKLWEANRKTFDAVEQARYHDISAKEVDECNMERYRCKIALQNKFFPQKKVEETKT